MDMYNRVFIFSQQQMEQKKKIEGKNVSFGKVVVNGVEKTWTDIILPTSDLKFSDSQKLIEGDIRKIRYTNPL